MSNVELSSDPKMVRLLAKGAVGGLLGGVRRRPADVPDVSVTRQGVRVDRDHLDAYERLCGFTVRDDLPTTYLHVLTFPLQLTVMTRPDFPFALPGLVHVANRTQLLRRVDAREPLDLSVRAQDLRDHPRGRQVDLVGEVAVAGELVWRGRSTYLAKGRSHADADRVRREEPLGGPPQARWQLPGDLGRQYAKVSGDANPIHLSALTAKAFGFPRTIAHGMWSLAACLAQVQARVPSVAVVDAEFAKPVLLPGTVEVRTAALDDGLRVELSSRGKDHPRLHVRATVTS